MAIHQSVARQHNEWIALVEPTGPFPAVPVLAPAFRQGLPTLDQTVRRDVLRAYDEWADGQRGARGPDPALHTAWIEYVLGDLLGYPADIRPSGAALPPQVVHTDARGAVRRPTYAIVDGDTPRLLVAVEPPDTPLAARRGGDSPETAFADLLRDSRVPLGLLTNGEDWVAVFETADAPTGFARFPAGLWSEEPLIARAFVALFCADRLLDGPQTTLDLYRDSLTHQHDVTEQLGRQVRKAIEVLLQALDRCDRDADRALLAGYAEAELYEAALTVMMRLVFLFFAEEQEPPLLPMDSDVWQQHYAASTLREQLRTTADQHGEEVLARRADAWARLLATFRAVYGGVNHDDLRMVPHLGRLFDPDAFPFLEGRPRSTDWRHTPAAPLEIHNRATLHLLEALQLLQVSVAGGGVEARRLSFRGLGVEEIGTVYEGLLDHTATRARAPTLGLTGTQKCPDPTVTLTALEERTGEALLDWLEETTGRSRGALANALAAPLVPGADGEARWRRVCDNDAALLDRVRPYAALVRDDTLGDPVLYPKGTLHVTAGTDRRQTGTHYTPQTLAQEVVHYALEPIVYVGPAEGAPRQDWTLRPPVELLSLRICDPAMGSGAFLVQAAKQLAAHLLTAWAAAEAALPPGARAVLPHADAGRDAPDEEPLATEPREREMQALRLVCDRCLYGVDKNPLAVEMAKLSLWLLTLQKGRPFTFLDHALRAGDSLLGLTETWQIERLSLEKLAESPLPMLPRGWNDRLDEALTARRALRAMPSNDADAIRHKAERLADAERATRALRIAGDLVVGAALVAAVEPRTPEEVLAGASRALEALFGDEAAREDDFVYAADEARRLLHKHAQPAHGIRRPFHWVLEFPEVLCDRGFALIAGNPPFRGGTLAAAELGDDYMALVRRMSHPFHGKADIVGAFFRRLESYIESGSTRLAFIATASILRGESRESTLDPLIDAGHRIYWSRPPYKWPGSANVEVVSIAVGPGSNQRNITDGTNANMGLSLMEAVKVRPHRLTPDGSFFSALGVKLSPTNREMPLKVAWSLLRDAKIYRAALRFAIGGNEINQAVSLDDAHVAFDPSDTFRLDIARRLGGLPTLADLSGLDGLSHSAPAARLNAEMKRAPLVFACGETSVHLVFRQIPKAAVLLKHKAFGFPATRWATFAILQSSVFQLWAWMTGLRRKADLVFSSKRCSATFPRPSAWSSPRQPLRELDLLAESYHHERTTISSRDDGRGITLGEVYNLFHDPTCTDDDIAHLRALHRQLDEAVAAAYGWADLALDHGFHDTRLGVRYTVSDHARRALLARLLELNHARYADEVARGLHDKKRKSKGRARHRGAKAARDVRSARADDFAPTQGDLFGGPQLTLGEASPAAHELTPDRVFDALRAADAPLGKAAVVEQLGTDAGWGAAIKALLADDRVVREGKGRGTVYRVRASTPAEGA